MMLRLKRTLRIWGLFGILLAAGLACRIGPGTPTPSGVPLVTLTDPLPGRTFPVGEPVRIQSTSTDADGIQRAELWVDNKLIRVDVNPDAGSPYIVSQPWQSDVPGTHIVQVKAFDNERQEGQSQSIAINLAMGAQTLPETTEVAQASPSPTEEPVPPAAAPTESPTAPPTDTPSVMCTPPLCQADEVYYCPGDCPNGCGTQCATPTPTMAPPPTFEPTGIDLLGLFQPVWEQAGVRDYLGYPIGEGNDDRQYARQYFERGYLYWWNQPGGPGQIWAVEIPQPAAGKGFRWTGPYDDTWDGGDPYTCDAARPNPNGPVRGFGKLWCDRPELAQAIGAARDSERGTGETTQYGAVQFFQGGVMLYSPLDREVWVLFDSGSWQRHSR